MIFMDGIKNEGVLRFYLVRNDLVKCSRERIAGNCRSDAVNFQPPETACFVHDLLCAPLKFTSPEKETFTPFPMRFS